MPAKTSLVVSTTGAAFAAGRISGFAGGSEVSLGAAAGSGTAALFPTAAAGFAGGIGASAATGRGAACGSGTEACGFGA